MDTEEKPLSWWLRLCGAVVGGIGSAVGAAVLFFLGALLGVAGSGNPMLFVVSMGVTGACVGFALPKQTLDSLCIYLAGPD
jgi:hypothetical protein